MKNYLEIKNYLEETGPVPDNVLERYIFGATVLGIRGKEQNFSGQSSNFSLKYFNVFNCFFILICQEFDSYILNSYYGRNQH